MIILITRVFLICTYHIAIERFSDDFGGHCHTDQACGFLWRLGGQRTAFG
jgi:hypothetical protein